MDETLRFIGLGLFCVFIGIEIGTRIKIEMPVIKYATERCTNNGGLLSVSGHAFIYRDGLKGDIEDGDE